MSENLHHTLVWKKTLLASEDHLLQQARHLYQCGFRPPAPGRPGISAAQMAAVDEKLQSAATRADALKNIGWFLNNQQEKLKKRRDRTGQAESWLLPGKTEDRQALGDILSTWLTDENRYLPPGIKPSREYDRLALLRRFWSYFYNLYRYDRIWETSMVFVETPLNQGDKR